MQGADFADHLCQHVIEFGAVSHAFCQRRIFVAYLEPVDAAHLSVEQVVAMHTPGVAQHLLPFQFRIGWEAPVLHADFGFADVIRDFCTGIDDQEFTCAIAQHNTLFIRRQIILTDAAGVDFCGCALFAEGDGFQAGAIIGFTLEYI